MVRRKIFTDEECARFGEDLRQAVKKVGLDVTRAAALLGITRQSMYSHFKGKHQPRWRVVERAVRMWDLTVYAQGQRFDKAAFGPSAPKAKASSVQLLLLPEAIEQLENSNLEVRVIRKEAGGVVLEVHVKFGT
jgi:DNA-binding XRE family transcriptional regulator